MSSKRITQAQVVAVAELLGLNPMSLVELNITTDEVEATYIDRDATKHGGPIVRNVHTYPIDRTRKEA